MECNKIENLVEKYFNGETTIHEEQELKNILLQKILLHT